MKRLFLLLMLTTGCAQMGQMEPVPDPILTDEPEDALVDAPAPPDTARSVEQFDTTTEEQRAEAANVSSGGTRLGETVASLGDAAAPGFWMETPLVQDSVTGRLVNPENGNEVEVLLRPIDGGSSRVSLAALRILEVPLGALATLEVYRNE